MGGRTCICIEETCSEYGINDGLWIYMWNRNDARLDLYDKLYNFPEAIDISINTDNIGDYNFLKYYISKCFDIGSVQEYGNSHYGKIKNINCKNVVISEYDNVKLKYSDWENSETIDLFGNLMKVEKIYGWCIIPIHSNP